MWLAKLLDKALSDKELNTIPGSVEAQVCSAFTLKLRERIREHSDPRLNWHLGAYDLQQANTLLRAPQRTRVVQLNSRVLVREIIRFYGCADGYNDIILWSSFSNLEINANQGALGFS